MKTQNIIIILSITIIALIATLGIIALDSDILEKKDKIKPGTVAADIDHISKVQIPSLVQTHKIQSDLLEGVEEAFAYIILDDENEKTEFYQKMTDFENRVDNYITFNPEFDDKDGEEYEILTSIVLAQTELVKSATAMFESHESGELDLDTVLAFEENIDKIVPLIDELIEEEIEDINEHVHEIAEIVEDIQSEKEDD